MFFVLHFLLYPASNGYNSYFDRDEGSIGGLKHPPAVTKELYRMSLLLDVVALVLALYVSVWFAGMCLIYGLVSKAYSHPSIRLKKLPVASMLAAGIFQGYWVVVGVIGGLSSNTNTFTLDIQVPALWSSLLLIASYPMTQIYQHREDKRRGDMTISRKLGIRGTFLFSLITFAIAVGVFSWYLHAFQTIPWWLLVVLLSPVAIFFGFWYHRVHTDLSAANFKNTMRLNMISATCLNIFFLAWWVFF